VRRFSWGQFVVFANLAATIFLVGALAFFQECVTAVRSGTARAEFGYEFSRLQMPGMYWMLVLANAGVGVMSSAAAYWALTSDVLRGAAGG
jgi:hypothetical protein